VDSVDQQNRKSVGSVIQQKGKFDVDYFKQQ
jgi:hypothetical protein